MDAPPTTTFNTSGGGDYEAAEPPPPPPANPLSAAPPVDTPSGESGSSSSEGRAAQSATSARTDRVPPYQRQQPELGFELATSLKALGTSTIPETESSQIRALSLQLDYQPALFQKFGMLGLGGSLNGYVLTDAGSFKLQKNGSSFLGFWSVGAQLRYQARFFREQWVVPTVGYGAELWSYRLSTAGQGGRILATGPFFGAQLLLNFLEPSAASENYIANGISRTYLLAELRSLSGTDDPITLTGSSLFFGLRFEY
jgi:hypothetical protein